MIFFANVVGSATCSVSVSSQLGFEQGYHLAGACGTSGGVLLMFSCCESGVYL